MKTIFSLIMTFMLFLFGVHSIDPGTEVNCSSNSISTPNASELQPQDDNFGFNYSIISDTILRGQCINIRVDLINQQNTSYTWTGSYTSFRSAAELVCIINGEEFVILPNPIPSSDDYGEHEIASGEKRSCNYFFDIPTDAAKGSYSLICSFMGTQKKFDNIFTLE